MQTELHHITRLIRAFVPWLLAAFYPLRSKACFGTPFEQQNDFVNLISDTIWTLAHSLLLSQIMEIDIIINERTESKISNK